MREEQSGHRDRKKTANGKKNRRQASKTATFNGLFRGLSKERVFRPGLKGSDEGIENMAERAESHQRVGVD